MGVVQVVGLNYTLTKAFFQHFVFTGIAQGWTLTVEECFYALAPLLLLGLARSAKKYALLAMYGVTLLALGCAIVWLAPHTLGFFKSFNFMFTYTFFGRCMEFLYGIGLALFMRGKPDQAGPGGGYTWGGIAWIAACVVAGTIVNPAPPTQEAYSWLGLGFNNLLLPLGIVSLFRGLMTEQTWFRQVLETKLFDLLGKSSYAFYLVHLGIVSILLKRHLTDNPLLLFPLMVLFSIGLYYCLEEPLQRKLRARSREKTL
ncbi:acyltransferase family protein [Hymenobacter rubripertinctus]|uniref:Acyltransferase n=1 Tax=Hymenobacter rubripertinctus TaxID=2029981 RepID=A0A418QH09_9BACT|nr:acyltransferase family protein [Hymenobacter rubripertinctus]RIY04521.1 acyltransferase [Hymenobacter rubripertinctus]